jgi:hypothetical protein
MRHLRYLLGLVICASALCSAARAEDAPAFFNGKDLTGWEGRKDAWKVVDGAIVGFTPEGGLKENTFLCTKAKYKDFELSFQIKLKDTPGANSGVQIRSETFGEKEKYRVKGPQADVGEGYWGSLYGEGFGGMMKQSSGDVLKRIIKKGEFNDYSIRCVGKKCTIKINGETLVDDTFDKEWADKNKGKIPMPDEGIIALQLHVTGTPMEVTFKNFKFTDLSKK